MKKDSFRYPIIMAAFAALLAALIACDAFIAAAPVVASLVGAAGNIATAIATKRGAPLTDAETDAIRQAERACMADGGTATEAAILAALEQQATVSRELLTVLRSLSPAADAGKP